MYDIRLRACVLFLLGTFAVPASASATTCEAKSGSGSVALLELYTSEGCSSCPPADRWLAELTERGLTLERVVPLAFHVDYWNYLGWVDRFAQADFTRRQETVRNQGGARVVYTPQFVLNGRDYSGWHRRDVVAEVAQLNRVPARADISLQLRRDGTTLRIVATAQTKDRNERAALYIALYENRLQSHVRAGENEGRRLIHASVVHRLIGPVAPDNARSTSFRETVELDASWKTADLGVAAFVQKQDNAAVLQALALPLCR